MKYLVVLVLGSATDTSAMVITSVCWVCFKVDLATLCSGQIHCGILTNMDGMRLALLEEPVVFAHKCSNARNTPGHVMKDSLRYFDIQKSALMSVSAV